MWITTENGDLLNLKNVGAIVKDGHAAVALVDGERVEISSQAATLVIIAIENELREDDAWRDNHVVDLESTIADARAERAQAEAEQEEHRRRLYAVNGVPLTPVSDCGFSSRTLNALHRQGIKTLQEVAVLTKAELLSIRNFGQKSLEEVLSAFDAHIER